MTLNIDPDTFADLQNTSLPEGPEVFPDGHCEHCGCPYGVFLEDSRTMYERRQPTRYEVIAGIQIPNPNAPLGLCRECADEHHAFWDDMWRDYYSSIL